MGAAVRTQDVELIDFQRGGERRLRGVAAAELQEVFRLQAVEFALRFDLGGIASEEPRIPDAARVVAAPVVGVFGVELLRRASGAGSRGGPARTS